MLKIPRMAYYGLMCAFLVMIASFYPVHAATELNLGSSIYNTGGGFGSYPYGGDIANRYCVMANGDIVVAYITTHPTTGYNVVTLKIVGSTGSLKSTNTYTVDASGYTGNAHTTNIVSVVPDYETNVALIFISDGAYLQKATNTVLEYNIVTHAITAASVDTHEVGVYAQYNNIGYYKFGADYYFILNAQYNANSWIQVYKYTDAGVLTHEFHSIDTFVSSTTVELAGGFQDPDDPSLVYTITCDYSDGGGTPEFAIVDLQDESVTALATGGLGYLCSPVLHASSFRGGGVELVANDTMYQMYFNWDFTSSESMQITKVIQHRMTFTNPIGSGTLVEQGDIVYTIADTVSVATEETVTNHVYWLSKSEAQAYFVYRNNLDDWASIRLNIPDWEDMAETEFEENYFEYGADAYFPEISVYSIYNKVPNSDVAIVANSATELFVYTGMSVDVADIQVYLTSHSPNDTPLKTNTAYTYRVTAYNAGQLWRSGLVGFQMDNGITEVKPTNTLGYYDFTGKLTTVAGLHIITVTAYNNYELLDSEEYSYVFIIGEIEEGEDNEGLALILGMFSQIIAPAVILLLPTFLFYSIIPTAVGAVTGLTLGALMGMVGNVLPPYVLIVIIILDVLMLFIGRGGE